MANDESILIDELHLSLRVPNNLPDDEIGAVRRVLAGDVFLEQLRRAVRAALREFPELQAVRGSLSR